MGSTSQSQSWKSLSREKNLCFATSAETDSSPSFYWHRDSDCELWGQIFPLKKEEKKENRKPLIFVSWGMCKNEWDLSQISVFCRHCLSLFFPRLKDSFSWKCQKLTKYRMFHQNLTLFYILVHFKTVFTNWQKSRKVLLKTNKNRKLPKLNISQLSF